ncbi:hypothetical protein DPMN_128796 [Dreissena polymorpha]|uniref:Uncharacterized protein n=1 Tax=Dreissena polymorpha TaxID=45954 RepID=A0A9D4H1I0_DREPO|nr:hypothetical protein DPMN_128796 [Dreissena polymorpha]
MADQVYLTPIAAKSSSKSRANSCFNRDQTRPDIENDIEREVNNLPNFENEHQSEYQETLVLRYDFKTPCSQLSFNIRETEHELYSPHYIEAEPVQDHVEAEQAHDTSLERENVSSNIRGTELELKSPHTVEAEQAHVTSLEGEKLNLEDTQTERHEIRYRDSKPLLKTYMIKMLFFAMKTAYTDDKSWQPTQLSFLVKMALCMIYYAHISKEKGIYNFWFQELVENRTRSSTCTEVLYCLDHLVEYLSKLLEVDHEIKISSPE